LDKKIEGEQKGVVDSCEWVTSYRSSERVNSFGGQI